MIGRDRAVSSLGSEGDTGAGEVLTCGENSCVKLKSCTFLDCSCEGKSNGEVKFCMAKMSCGLVKSLGELLMAEDLGDESESSPSTRIIILFGSSGLVGIYLSSATGGDFGI